MPPLYPGDRLRAAEFLRRYEAMPAGVRAELIGGVVYMPPPPVGPEHGDLHVDLGTLLGVYRAATPGVRASDNATVVLGDDSAPQPDLHLRVLPEHGGRVVVGARGLLAGAPELVIEVAHSSEAIDLHGKRSDYERAGVLEYVVMLVRERQLRAFDLTARRERAADLDRVYRSMTFPGLWIDSAALTVGDLRRALRTLAKGLKSSEHAAFIDRLKAAARPRPDARRATRKPRPRKRPS